MTAKEGENIVSVFIIFVFLGLDVVGASSSVIYFCGCVFMRRRKENDSQIGSLFRRAKVKRTFCDKWKSITAIIRSAVLGWYLMNCEHFTSASYISPQKHSNAV